MSCAGVSSTFLNITEKPFATAAPELVTVTSMGTVDPLVGLTVTFGSAGGSTDQFNVPLPLFDTVNTVSLTTSPHVNVSDPDFRTTDKKEVGVAVGVTGVAVGATVGWGVYVGGGDVGVVVGGRGVGVGVLGPVVTVGGNGVRVGRGVSVGVGVRVGSGGRGVGVAVPTPTVTVGVFANSVSVAAMDS
jgi:hypothetical protein